MKEDLQKRQCLAHVQSWKLLIERDLFDSYSQRINACFNYLDDNGEGYFTLKDVTDRGKFVFSYLGNPLENKNPYAAMDLFRRYDSRASGEVYLDDFVGGTIRFLQKAANEGQALNEIINEIVETSSTPMEEYVDNVHIGPGEDYPLEAMECTIAHILEDLDEGGVYPEFSRSLFAPLKYIFKERLTDFVKLETEHFLSDEGATDIHNEEEDITVTVTKEKLRELLIETLKSAVRELQAYFRFSDRALVDILVPHHSVHDYSRLLHNFSPSKESIEGTADDAFNAIIDKPSAIQVDREPFWVIKESNKGHMTLIERRRRSSIVPIKIPPPKPVVIGANVAGTATPRAMRRFSRHFGASVAGAGEDGGVKPMKKKHAKKMRRLSSKMGIDLETLLRAGIGPEDVAEDVDDDEGEEDGAEDDDSDLSDADDDHDDDDVDDWKEDEAGGSGATNEEKERKRERERKKEHRKSTETNKGGDIWSFLSDCGVTLDDLRDPTIMSNLDDSQVFLLKTAFKSLENFMSLLAQEKQYRNQAEKGLLGSSAIFNPYDEASGAFSSSSSQSSPYKTGSSTNRFDTEEAQIQQQRDDELRLSMALASGEEGEEVVEELVRKMRARVTTPSITESIFPDTGTGRGVGSGAGTGLGAGGSGTSMAVAAVGPVNEELLQAFVETQSQLKRTEMRLQILQLVQKKIKKNAKNSLKGDGSRGRSVSGGGGVGDGPTTETKGGDEDDSADDGGGEDAVDRIIAAAEQNNKLSKVSQVSFLDKSADNLVPSTDDIMTEIEGMKSLLADNGSTETALGYMMSTPCALIPLSDQADYFGLEWRGREKGSNSSEGRDRIKGASVTRDLEKLSDSLMNVMKRRVADEQMYSNLAVKAKRLEEQLAENMCKLEESDQEHAELLSNAIELQILRDETFRLRAELATAQVYVNKFEELRKDLSISETTHARKLAEMQKQIDLAQLKGNSKDMDTATSKIQELQHTIQTLTGDRNRLLKENNRLANANTVSDKRVKSALMDHVTLHQKVHVAEDELAASRAHTSRLERDINELRRFKVNNSELVRKIEMMEKEIAQKDGHLAEAEDTANHYRRQKAELGAADMHINTLEEKVSSLSIEAEKGTIAAEQLAFTRETLQEKNTINRELMVENANLVQQVEDLEYEQLNNQQLMDMMEDYKRRSDKVTGLVAEVARLRGLSRAASKALHDSDFSLSATRNKLLNLEKDKERFNANANRLKELEDKYSDARNQIEKLKAQLAARPSASAADAAGAASSGATRRGDDKGSTPSAATAGGDASKNVPGGGVPAAGALAQRSGGGIGSKWEEMQKRRAAEKAQEMEQTALKNAPGSVDARQRQLQTAAAAGGGVLAAAVEKVDGGAVTGASGGVEGSSGPSSSADSDNSKDGGEKTVLVSKLFSSLDKKEDKGGDGGDDGSSLGSKKSKKDKKDKKEKKSKDGKDKGDEEIAVSEASRDSKKDKKDKKEKRSKDKDKADDQTEISKDSMKEKKGKKSKDKGDDETTKSETSKDSKKDKDKKDKKDNKEKKSSKKSEGDDDEDEGRSRGQEKKEKKDKKSKKEERDESPSKRKVKFDDDASSPSSTKKKVGKINSDFVSLLSGVLEKDN